LPPEQVTFRVTERSVNAAASKTSFGSAFFDAAIRRSINFGFHWKQHSV
jgi:hypothetical protein